MVEVDWWGYVISSLGLILLLCYLLLAKPSREKHWVEYAFVADGYTMPFDLRWLVMDACWEEGIASPKSMTVKYVPQIGGGFIGGYTRYADGGEVCVVYGPKSLGHDVNAEERETVLHETSHWIMGEDECDHEGSKAGHTAKFYAKLLELCLRNNVDPKYMITTESNYMGDVVFDGISLFDRTYNA
jgi:hypothetical protein